MNKFRKYATRAVIGIGLYMSLIAFPLQYLPLPGYRAVGAELVGGWRWGGAFGCFDDVPVLFIEGRDGYLVRKGEIIWKLLENIELKFEDGLMELTGKMYPVNIRDPEASINAGARKPRSVRINYKDNGKILIVKEMYLDGARVRDKIKIKSNILAQCGYPGLTLFLLRKFGIKQYWRSPVSEYHQDRHDIEVR